MTLEYLRCLVVPEIWHFSAQKFQKVPDSDFGYLPLYGSISDPAKKGQCCFFPLSTSSPVLGALSTWNHAIFKRKVFFQFPTIFFKRKRFPNVVAKAVAQLGMSYGIITAILMFVITKF